MLTGTQQEIDLDNQIYLNATGTEIFDSFSHWDSK